MKLTNVIDDMIRVEQGPGQDVLQHGIAVFEYYMQLWLMLAYDIPNYRDMRLPDWFTTYGGQLFQGQPPLRTHVIPYLVFHDCGKPAVRYADETGHAHYPDHAWASAKTWVDIGGNDSVAQLMRDDMLAHIPSTSAQYFAQLPEAPCLLLSALAAIHANAELFGGKDSKSFQHKLQHLSVFGSAVCKERYGKP